MSLLHTSRRTDPLQVDLYFCFPLYSSDPGHSLHSVSLWCPLIQDTYSRSLRYGPHTTNVKAQILQQQRGNFPRKESPETSAHHKTVWKTGLQPEHAQCGASGFLGVLLCWPYRVKGSKTKLNV